MPDIGANVGEHGAPNKSHDVAMVQAMLRVVKNAKNATYLNVDYTGTYGPTTKSAISAFQNDHKLIQPKGAEKLGLMTPGGATIQKLNEMLPATHKSMRVIPNTKTVHIEGTAADAATSKAAVTGNRELEAQFRAKVGDLIERMFKQHKIVLGLTPTGGRRTFAQQAAETNTKAGPGESNHNFGRAVDLGFKALKWVRGDGTIKQDSFWLNTLEQTSAAKANAFWDARDAIALNNLGLHRLQFERIHLQAFNDATVSATRSLARLLTAVGKTKWQPRYKSDLGYGGALHNVGTAKQIWAGTALVTKAMIAQARSAKTGKKVTPADIKAQELNEMKKTLKGDFELADRHWVKWTPVP